MQILLFINLAFAAQLQMEDPTAVSKKYEKKLKEFKKNGSPVLAKFCTDFVDANPDLQKNWITELREHQKITTPIDLDSMTVGQRTALINDLMASLTKTNNTQKAIAKAKAAAEPGMQIIREAIEALHKAPNADRKQYSGARFGKTGFNNLIFHGNPNGFGWRKHLQYQIMENYDIEYKNKLKAEMDYALKLYQSIEPIPANRAISKQKMLEILQNYVAVGGRAKAL